MKKSESIKRFCVTPMSSDCTSGYATKGFEGKTVNRIISDVISLYPREWGYIYVVDRKTLRHIRVAEYRYGKVLKTFRNDLLNRVCESCEASGGWSSMDYFILCKRPLK